MKILWIPHTAWHIPQRAHYFVKHLAKCHEVHVTNAVADFNAPRDYFSVRYLQNFFYRRSSEAGIMVHGVPRISPALFSPALRRFNTRVFTGVVHKIIRDYRIDVVVGTFLIPPPKAQRLVFDLFDENVAFWRGIKGNEVYADEIARSELAYLQQADAIIAASSVLVDKARALGTYAPIHLIPNGIELDQYAPATSSALRSRLGVRGPVVGSLANYDNPAELDILLQLASLLADTDVTILIAGRGSALPKAQQRVRKEKLSNVRFVGYVPFSEAPRLVAQFDVGLCVYTRNPMDEARSPMRFLMYAAAGIPIVCSNLEEVRRMDFPNAIRVAGDADSFAEGIQAALNLPRCRPPQIAAYDIRRLVAQYEHVLQGKAEYLGVESPAIGRTY